MKIDKIIFLDIDGVLNSDEFARWCVANPNFVKNGGNHFVSPLLVGRIIKICNDTRAKIVLTSSWRLFEFDNTIKNLSSYRDLKPIIDRMVGITPRTQERIRGLEIKYFLNDCRKDHMDSELISKDDEIVRYPEYVIIDDDTDMLNEQLEHFVHTDFITGITDTDVEKAIKILNDENK